MSDYPEPARASAGAARARGPATIRILDQARTHVASAVVAAQEGNFTGQVDPGQMPTAFRRLFEEYEAIVNGQTFSLLNAIEDRIAAVPVTVVFSGEHEAAVQDLQIYPTSGRISFKIVRWVSAEKAPP